MSKFHVFIDGSWLFNVCGPDKILASKMAKNNVFRLDFKLFVDAIMNHINSQSTQCDSIGDCYNIISIFDLPSDFDTWVGKPYDSANPSGGKITQDEIRKTKNAVSAREKFSQNALDAGFQKEAVLSVKMKEWIVQCLTTQKYQEKQVDTTLVALIVKYAIDKPKDYLAVVSGDADIIPAIKIACPDYTRNICIVTTHPDELKKKHRQSSFAYTDFSFNIPNLYLQDIVPQIVSRKTNEHVYTCKHCAKVFLSASEITSKKQPFCQDCQKLRT